jgi:hypothetical protein
MDLWPGTKINIFRVFTKTARLQEHIYRAEKNIFGILLSQVKIYLPFFCFPLSGYEPGAPALTQLKRYNADNTQQ